MSIDRLSAEDQLMLGASAVWPQEIGALALLDGTRLFDASGQFRIEAVQRTVRSRLDLVPRFRQRIEVPGRGLGAPLWVDARGFDVRDHVRVLALPDPADEEALLLTAERLRRRRLDPSRPPWEMWLITGLPDRRVALYVKVHHAMADGMAALSMLGAFLDAAPDAPRSHRARGCPNRARRPSISWRMPCGGASEPWSRPCRWWLVHGPSRTASWRPGLPPGRSSPMARPRKPASTGWPGRAATWR